MRGSAERGLAERSERGTLPAVATTVLLGFFFIRIRSHSTEAIHTGQV